jgi:multidrug efflux pump subunit AcrA (membrane-fusion protein)
MRRKKKIFIWLFMLVLISSSIYLGKDYFPIPILGNSSKSGGEDSYAQEIDLSSVIEVSKGNIKKTVSTSGYIKPENEVYLSFATTGTTGGTVESIMVTAGQVVEKGQKLVTLEDKQERLNYLRAKNEYELAKISGSPTQIEEKKLTMEVALDKYESKTLKAPFSGKIVDIFVEEGDFIGGNNDVVYMIDDSSYEVKVSISEVDCLRVEVGQDVEIELDILKEQLFQGKVVEVAEYAKSESGVVTVPVTLRMDKVSSYFKPGFSATAEIIVDSVENSIIVPVTAISQGNQSSTVLKVENNKGVPVQVKTGISDGFYQEIVAGLQEGDHIVVNNYQRNISVDSQTGVFGGMGGSSTIPMTMPGGATRGGGQNRE